MQAKRCGDLDTAASRSSSESLRVSTRVWQGICWALLSQGFLSLECWIGPCLSEIDKVLEKVRLSWRPEGRLGQLEIFLPSQEKSVLYLSVPFAPRFRNSCKFSIN
jgi:hypothetical protein